MPIRRHGSLSDSRAVATEELALRLSHGECRSLPSQAIDAKCHGARSGRHCGGRSRTRDLGGHLSCWPSLPERTDHGEPVDHLWTHRSSSDLQHCAVVPGHRRFRLRPTRHDLHSARSLRGALNDCRWVDIHRNLCDGVADCVRSDHRREPSRDHPQRRRVRRRLQRQRPPDHDAAEQHHAEQHLVDREPDDLGRQHRPGPCANALHLNGNGQAPGLGHQGHRRWRQRL